MSLGLRQPISRRGFLTVGTIGLGGLTLADLLRVQARAEQKNYAPIAAKADSVIHIFLPGGIAHQETFDPKPFAPVEYRGEHGLGRDQDRRRAVQRDAPPDRPDRRQADGHPLDDPRRGGPRARHAQHVHGLPAQPGPAVSQHGQRGLARVRPQEQPAALRLRARRSRNVYAGTGYLSSSFSPFCLGSDPASKGFQVQDLNLPGGIDEPRFATRRHVLDAVNDHFAQKEKSDDIAAMDTFYQRAYSLISSQKAREAFNIDAEPAKVRDEYGRNAAGQRMLMARRLVAAGRPVRHRPLRRLGLPHPDRRRA